MTYFFNKKKGILNKKYFFIRFLSVYLLYNFKKNLKLDKYMAKKTVKKTTKEGFTKVTINFKPEEETFLNDFRKKCSRENRDLTKGIKQAMRNDLNQITNN